MALEVGTFVQDLVITNPSSSDPKGQGDDHLTLIKKVLKNTFPTATKALSFPTSVVIAGAASVTAAQNLTTFAVNTNAGAFDLILPALSAGDAGWQCAFVKITNDVNPFFIDPPAGTLSSGEVFGLARARRCIPGRRTTALWTGTAWVLDRVIGVPVGGLIPIALNFLPIGFEWPNGQVLGAGNYPEYASVRGSGNTPDLRGRVVLGKDDMGGGAIGRITAAECGISGTVFESAGGVQSVALTTAQLAIHTHAATVTDPQHSHTATAAVTTGQQFAAGGITGGNADTSITTVAASTGISVSNANAGSGATHSNVPPGIVENFALVVE